MSASPTGPPPLPDPIAAVTAPDPWATYAVYRDRGPVVRDDGRDCWVISGYGEVAAVLGSDRAHTRPAAEPVPTGLIGSATGDVFGHLVRMTDGPASRATKAALIRAIAALPATDARRVAEVTAAATWRDVDPAGGESGPMGAVFAGPARTVGALLGLGPETLDALPAMVRAFARAIAPPPFTGPRGASEVAVGAIREALGVSLGAPTDATAPPSSLLAILARDPVFAGAAGRSLLLANAIGLLFQSLDATAGLAVGAILARPGDDLNDPDFDALLTEVLRHGSPVRHTQRFTVAPLVIGGQTIPAGARVVLLLAAANRDPAVFPEPDRFRPGAHTAAPLTFGIGPHQCPGQRLAREIARATSRAAVRAGRERGVRWETDGFEPSPNTRIPVLVGRTRAPAGGTAEGGRSIP